MSIDRKPAARNPDNTKTVSIDAPRNAENIDPRVSELIGFADAARRSGFSYWTYHNARRAGHIRGIEVPGGAIGLLRSDVAAFDAEHRRRLDERKQKREKRPA